MTTEQRKLNKLMKMSKTLKEAKELSRMLMGTVKMVGASREATHLAFMVIDRVHKKQYPSVHKRVAEIANMKPKKKKLKQKVTQPSK